MVVRHHHISRGVWRSRLAAAGVMSWPVPMLAGRRRHFQLSHCSYKTSIHFANEYFRTLSRVVVHPHYRSLGFATLVTREIAQRCETRYLECSARMGDYSPFLTRAGFVQLSQSVDDSIHSSPAYFLFDTTPDLEMACPMTNTTDPKIAQTIFALASRVTTPRPAFEKRSKRSSTSASLPARR